MQKKSELTNNEKMEVPATNKTSKGIDIISGEIVEKALTNSLDIDKNQKNFTLDVLFKTILSNSVNLT